MDGWVVHVEREMGLKLNTNKNMGREGINEQERCSRVNVEELADGLNSIHMTIHKRGSLFTGFLHFGSLQSAKLSCRLVVQWPS